MKVAFDFEQYARRVSGGPCFVCAFVAGDSDYRHHLVYENDNRPGRASAAAPAALAVEIAVRLSEHSARKPECKRF